MIRFDLPLKRKALVSDTYGYRLYPVTLRAFAKKGEGLRFEVTTEILYSSTCPCSAALARELIREEFKRSFADGAQFSAQDFEKWLMSADTELPTPHAQRSLARVKVCMPESAFEAAGPGGLDFLPQFIDLLELAVGTPVQAAVKRVDEQEFARLNGENLMFCEDAARKLRFALESSPHILDYDVYVEHQESLHPHDAVSRVVKGVLGGFSV